METEQRPHILQTSAAAPGPMTQARGRALFNGQTEAGQTNSVVVYTDGTPQGNATAQAILQTADADFNATQAAFGGIALPQGQEGDDQTVPRTALPLQVLMDSQAGGAYHFGCNATDIYVEPDPQLANGFFVAELVEVFEAAINNGWDCGQTNGEGLSRVLAGERNANLGSLFVQTEQSWWANGHQDYVNSNAADDTNQDANGCATLFLYYLHTQLNFDWTTIVTTGGTSLGDTYQRLTNQDPAAGFSSFVALVSSLDTGAGLNLPASGNPFPLSGTGSQSGAGQGADQGVPVGAGAFGGYPPSSGGAYGSADGSAYGAGGYAASEGSATDSSGATPSDGAWAAVVAEETYVVPEASADGQPGAAQVDVLDEVEVVPWTAAESAPVGATPYAESPVASAPTPAPNPVTRVDGLDRTAPIEPRGLDTTPAAAPTRRRGEAIETMIAVLVVLIVLVALGLVMVLFTSGVIKL